MSTLERAIALAAEAHAGQTDKAEAPYILHLLRVMLEQETEQAMMAAVLHDLVEDTDYTFEDLEAQGFPPPVVEALRHVTKHDEEAYSEFVARAASHPIAREVKVADLEDNMDVTRLDTISDDDAERLAKYLRAYRQLTSPRSGTDTVGANG